MLNAALVRIRAAELGEESLLEDIVEPFAECLTEDAAKKIVALRAGPKLQRRIDDLAATFGCLSNDEKTEYDRYLAAYHFVTAMPARARQFRIEMRAQISQAD